MELVGEAAAAQGHVVLGAVGVARLAHDQARRLPFGDEGADAGKAGGVVDRLDHFERLGLRGQGVADGDADAFDTEIKIENRIDHQA
jgi:hypothetical protein